MSSLVKISNICLYIGVTNPGALQAIFDCKAVLDNAGVKYNNLLYPEPAQYANIFENLSTWTFGFDFTQYSFTDFPIVTWQEFYDDYEICDQVALSPVDLQNSNVINFKDLVV